MRKRKTPTLRFRGFNNDWEQRKLGDIAKIVMGQSPSSKNYTKNPEDYILVQGNADIRNGKVVPRVWTTQITKIAHKGDIILTVRAPVGEVAITDYTIVLGRGVASIKGNKFILQLLIKMNRNSFWNKLSTGSTFESINSNDIKKTIIFIPSIKEQNKIGNLLNLTDKLLTLQERKYEELKLLKKALLQNMFPYNENYNPKYRFLRFTKPWKKKQLGDLMDIGSVKRIHQSDWRSNGVRFLRARDIVANFKNLKPANCLYIDKKTYDQYTIQSGKVSKGDLLVTGVGTIGIPMLINTDVPLYFKDGNIIWFKNSNIIDHNFFYYSFISNTIQDFIKKSSGSGTVGTYTISNGRETPILLPSKEEQQKIGNLLKKCDDLIIFQKRKIKKSKSIKEFLLQNIFI